MERPRGKNDRGQAILEALWTLPAAGLMFFCLAAFCYLAFARAWIGYQSDQGLFCLAEGASESSCTSEVDKAIRRFLPFGELRYLSFATQEKEWRGEFDWRLGEVR